MGTHLIVLSESYPINTNMTRGGSRIREGGGVNLVPNSDTGGATNDDF